MGKKKGKKGGAGKDGAKEQQQSTEKEQQPSTSSAPENVQQEGVSSDGGKKRGKGKKGGAGEDGAKEQQQSTSSVPENMQQAGVSGDGGGKAKAERPAAAADVPSKMMEQASDVASQERREIPPQPGQKQQTQPRELEEIRYAHPGRGQQASQRGGRDVRPGLRKQQTPPREGEVKYAPSGRGQQIPQQVKPLGFAMPTQQAPRATSPGSQAWQGAQQAPQAMPPGFQARPTQQQTPQAMPPGFQARPTQQQAPQAMPPGSQPWRTLQQAGPKPPWGTVRGTSPLQDVPPQPVQKPPPGKDVPPQTVQKPPPHLEAPRGIPGPKGARAKSSQQQPAPPPQQQKQHLPGPAQRVEQVTKAMGKLSLQIPAKVGHGTKGQKTRVQTNMLPLNLQNLKNSIAIHYDVTFEPDRPKRLLPLAMEEFRKQHFRNRYPAFDGRKNLYSSGPLFSENVLSGEVNVKDEESQKPKPYKITVKFAAEVDLNALKSYMRDGSSLQAPQTALQVIDVVLRHAVTFRFVKVGRSFFTPPRGHIVDLGDGHEMWYGFFQSAILGWRPFLNVDVAHKGFPKALNCIALLDELFRSVPQELNRYQQEDLRSYIRGLKVDYELPNKPETRRTYRVNDIVNSAPHLTFKLDSGQQITVQQYFEKEKRQPLKYPFLPCLWVGNKNRDNKIYLPLEFCKIVQGQVVQKKMTELQTSNMIKKAATSTDIRQQKIMDALRTANFNNSSTVKEFGFSVADRFEEVDARILDPPSLEYGSKQRPVRPSRGVWRPSEFQKGSPLRNWAILNLNKFTRENDLRELGKQIVIMSRSAGMQINECASYTTLPPPFRDTRALEDYLKAQKAKQVQLVVVVIPDKDVYAKVKQTAEITIGILTQCIKARTLGRLSGSTVSNILLKVNSKLNGINHTLADNSRPECLRSPAMIVGADVTHPSPDQMNIPSVAAVSASHDPKAFQYNMEFRLQEARVEIIQDLENIMKNQLRYFYHRTGTKPERIIFYRDGVSEGQFIQVLNAELMAIRRACTGLEASYKPPITFLVVQKRHHTRFFPTRPEDCDGKNRNVPPGTVVDTDITHPTEADFYLVSHASIQGVSRPTKYHVLWDDSKMDEDALEQLTYYLCHMFSRCARSVSYPAPTYYAHLAAYRARVYLEGHSIKLTNLEQEQKQRKIKEDFLKSNPMFFV